MGTVPNVVAGASSNVDGGSPVATDLEPADSLPADGPDSSAIDTPQPEGGAQPEPGAEGAEGTEQAGGREDGRLIPKWMRAMKESDPEGYRAAKSAFFNLKDRETIHPTVQAAREEHELVDSLGGREGAAKLQEDAVFFKDAANQFLKGDPAFIKDLWEEDPIAAALHVSPMLDEFKARDFQGYKSTIARIWENDFKRLNFAPALQDLAAAIQSGDKATAAAIAKSIQEWHDSILTVSRQAEDPRVKTLLAERNKQHETRQETERQELLKNYRTESFNSMITEATKTFDSFFRNRKIDAEDRNDLIQDAVKLADKIVAADEAFKRQRDDYLKRGDVKSASRLTASRYAQEMTNSVKRVARRYGLVSNQAAPANNQQQRPNAPTQQPRPAEGYIAVTQRPQGEEIDHRRTTPEMIMSGKAILTNGRKVDWSKLKAKTA